MILFATRTLYAFDQHFPAPRDQSLWPVYYRFGLAILFDLCKFDTLTYNNLPDEDVPDPNLSHYI